MEQRSYLLSLPFPRRLSICLGLLGILLGLCGICGWVFHIAFLKSFLSDGATMKVNTALSIILCSLSLICLNVGMRKLPRVLLALTGLLCFLILAEHLLHVDLRIDEAWLKDHDKDRNIESPGRMSITTAIDLLLIIASLLLASYRIYFYSQFLVCISFMLVYSSMMGHLFGLENFYRLDSFSGVAASTAISLLILALGTLLFQSRKGWMIILFKQIRDRNLLIYLTSYFLCVAPLLIAFYLYLINKSRFNPTSGVLVLVILSALISIPLGYLVVKWLRRMDMELIKANQRLEIALDAGRLGSYDLDFLSGHIVCTDQCKINYGHALDETFNYEDLQRIVLPEYKAYIKAEIDHAIRTRSRYHSEYPIYWPDGSVHWVSVFGKPTFNSAGKAVGMIGVTFDITSQIQARNELESAFEQVRLSKEAAHLGTFDMDMISGKMEWDERCRLLFGISHQDAVSYERDFLGNVLGADRERITEFNRGAFVKNISNGEYDAEFRTLGVEDGKVRWVRAKGKVFFSEDEQPLRFIGSVLEITDQKENEMRKNDFIGVVSHELKTPLTSLKGYIQILSERARELGDVFQSDSLFKVDKQINKMSVMINSFLDVSRLESGKIHMNFTRFSIRALIEEIISESVQVVPNHTLIFLPGLPLTVEADRDKVGQVITNLISNAAKYSEKGKNITIECIASGLNFRVSVKDQGMGISAQDTDHLFERFYRVENPQTRQISGFGIGLYLSSEIVRRHKGRIWVKSTMGSGSTFFFEIPVYHHEEKALAHPELSRPVL